MTDNEDNEQFAPCLARSLSLLSTMTVSTPTTNADSAVQQQSSSSSSSSAIIPTTIKAVIFDLDGTLLDTESLSCRAVIESFAATNLAIPKDILDSLKDNGGLLLLPWELKRRILGMRGSEWVPIVLGYAQLNWGVEMTSSLDWKAFWEQPSTPTAAATDDDDDDDETKARETMVNAFWKAWEVGLNRLCSQVEACPGAVELVEALRAARVPMAIATSSRAASVRKKRANHEAMFLSIREIVSGDDPAVENGKPAPDIYLEAAKRLGVPPERCLVFEDAHAGARSGKAAGCHVVAVPDKRMEKSVYEDVSEEIIEDLWMFSGKRWGIDVEMKELR